MFSLQLKALREKMNLSQRDFASKIGVAPSTVGMWESGQREPDFEMALRLADFFNVSVDYLLGAGKDENRFNSFPSDYDGADMEDILNSLEEADGLMLYGDPLSDEARASIVAAMKLGMDAAKAKNKEKFTPKKYRKK